MAADGIRIVLMILEDLHHSFFTELAAFSFHQFMHSVFTEPGIREGRLVIHAIQLEIMGQIMVGVGEDARGLRQHAAASYRGGLNVYQGAVSAAYGKVKVGSAIGLSRYSDGVANILLIQNVIADKCIRSSNFSMLREEKVHGETKSVFIHTNQGKRTRPGNSEVGRPVLRFNPEDYSGGIRIPVEVLTHDGFTVLW